MRRRRRSSYPCTTMEDGRKEVIERMDGEQEKEPLSPPFSRKRFL